jgi:hypothetical protein
MTDIVERLRTRAATIPAQGDCLESEAVDEIERLRAALQKIANAPSVCPQSILVEFARAALKQTPCTSFAQVHGRLASLTYAESDGEAKPDLPNPRHSWRSVYKSSLNVARLVSSQARPQVQRCISRAALLKQLALSLLILAHRSEEDKSLEGGMSGGERIRRGFTRLGIGLSGICLLFWLLFNLLTTTSVAWGLIYFAGGFTNLALLSVMFAPFVICVGMGRVFSGFSE